MRRYGTREAMMMHRRRLRAKQSGQPLPSSVRPAMEQRFGHNFADVRVHADERAARAAAGIDARAFTIGRDIVFSAGQYSPATGRGQALLAHELAHVVQQERASASTRIAPTISGVGDARERDADAAAHAVMMPASPALRIADRLRANPVTAPTIQRAVSTWGGEWDTTKYNVAAVAGMDGVEIELKFTPNEKVDATVIGTLQTVQSQDKNGLVDLAGGAAAETATRRARTIQAPDTGAGTRIDAQAKDPHPIYAADPTQSLATKKTIAAWGHHGWRYMSSGVEHKQSATLIDTPTLSNARPESMQTFETTALALSGAQQGTYYGSVQWGWKKDTGGTVSKLPLTRISNDAPSNVFTAAGGLWNKSTTSTGGKALNLPIVFRGYAKADDTPIVSDPTNAAGSEIAKLKKNARVEVTNLGKKEPFNTGAATPWWHVTIVSDTDAGKVGWVLSSSLATDPVK